MVRYLLGTHRIFRNKKYDKEEENKVRI